LASGVRGIVVTEACREPCAIPSGPHLARAGAPVGGPRVGRPPPPRPTCRVPSPSVRAAGTRSARSGWRGARAAPGGAEAGVGEFSPFESMGAAKIAVIAAELRFKAHRNRPPLPGGPANRAKRSGHAGDGQGATFRSCLARIGTEVRVVRERQPHEAFRPRLLLSPRAGRPVSSAPTPLRSPTATATAVRQQRRSMAPGRSCHHGRAAPTPRRNQNSPPPGLASRHHRSWTEERRR
jgi:hypothetical protein